jgi:hypothetical protein
MRNKRFEGALRDGKNGRQNADRDEVIFVFDVNILLYRYVDQIYYRPPVFADEIINQIVIGRLDNECSFAYEDTTSPEQFL